MDRLKSIETTLELLSKSEKKQLTQYVNSNSKSHGKQTEKENQGLDNLSDIKRNLFGGSEEEGQQEHLFERKTVCDDKRPTKGNTKRTKKLINDIKQEKIASESKSKAAASKKLLK